MVYLPPKCEESRAIVCLLKLFLAADGLEDWRGVAILSLSRMMVQQVSGIYDSYFGFEHLWRANIDGKGLTETTP